MEQLKALWTRVRDSLWFVPGLFTVGGAVMAVVLVELSERVLGDVDRYELWWLFGGSSSGARQILAAIAGSLITVTGTVFSVTIIALQLTSQQFTPRVLRNFMADRSNQVVLGVLIGTFTYALVVLRAVRGANDDADALVPVLAVTGAVIFALISVGFLIYFIDHVARSIQVNSILNNVAQTTAAAVHRIFHDGGPPDTRPAAAAVFDDSSVGIPDTPPAAVASRRSGYVQSVDRESIVRRAEKSDLTVRMEVGIGDFLIEGQRLYSIWPAAAVTEDVENWFRAATVLGPERTPYQDAELGLIEIVDIAVKAMSPSVNDPTTAMHSLDRIGQLLVAIGRSDAASTRFRTAQGRVCLVLRQPTFERAVGIGFTQIRHYSADNAGVMAKLSVRKSSSNHERRSPKVAATVFFLTHRHEMCVNEIVNNNVAIRMVANGELAPQLALISLTKRVIYDGRMGGRR
jgi:uncharacterized membrane protein